MIASNSRDDADLVDQYIKALGYNETIVFDASNIKQFWVDRSVASKDGLINIILKTSGTESWKSIPLKIQLANVLWTQDCIVDVITDKPDLSFSVTNSKSKLLSTSSVNDDFIQYHVYSSSFHMEDLPDYSFNLVFGAKDSYSLSIKKIILSFKDNKDATFLSSPGTLVVTDKDVSAKAVPADDGKVFSVTGKNSGIFVKKNIILSNTPLNMSIKIKNVGQVPTAIRVGYIPYTKDQTRLDLNNYPYKNINAPLTVVSAEIDSNKIIVDSFPQWEKNCCIALHANDDLSDIPNTDLVDGKITDVKQIADGKVEITIDKPLKQTIKNGDRIRITGVGGTYFYLTVKVLQPGEEETFSASVLKDDNYLQFSGKSFSRGVYYVRPLILSYSSSSGEENTILISDFSISY